MSSSPIHTHLATSHGCTAQDYAYEHMQIRNCNNLHVMGDSVMYNSLARLPFTQATIVDVSNNARNLTFQVHACSGIKHTVLFAQF